MFSAVAASRKDIAALRDESRAEAACQIVHDSRYDRRGWCEPYLLHVGGTQVGFAGLAMAGPWQGSRTAFDFYVLRTHRAEWPALWDAFAAASRADAYELQTNLPLISDLLTRLGGPHQFDRIVYGEGHATALPAAGARLRRVTSVLETQLCIRERAGQCQWDLELDGAKVGEGSLLFHYNEPFADIAMEIHEPFRRRGLGAYLVQELKLAPRGLGAIPAARTNADNVASQRTLEKAGLIRAGRIATGQLVPH